MPSISVIVPVYKVELFLCRCVDSILEQSFPDFELILVDDGSPDNCGQICDAYAQKDSRVHVIHQQNAGLSAARNAAMDWVYANSNSQWISFIDSDDWVHRDYLLRLYSIAKATNCLVSACRFAATGGEDILQVYSEEYQCLSADDYYCGEERDGCTPAIACAKLYHRSLLESLRYPVGKLHEDEFTTYKAVYAAEKVGVTRAVLYAYYQNPAGIMQSKWNPRRMHSLEAVEQQIAFAQETGRERFLRKAARQYLYSAYEQLKVVNQLPEHRRYRSVLRKKLRSALKLGREVGNFPLTWQNLWAYEEAYPMKPFWWLLSKVR